MSPIDRLSLPFTNGAIDVAEMGATLVLRARPCPAYGLFERENLYCRQAFYPTYQQLVQAGFAMDRPLPEQFTHAIVHITRARNETRALIAKAYKALAPNGVLIVDGDKTDGIESHLKAVKKLLPVTATLSKAHGKVFWLSKTETPAALTEWLDALEPRQIAEGFYTRAGVFSADKIDKGSAQLVPFLAGKLKGNGADLGAGWGYLSKQVLAENPAIDTLELIEADRHALDCARLNVKDPRAAFHWADALTHTTQAPLDFVVMNPPFHETRKADPALGQRFIAAAAKLLKPAGSLYMVANRQLAYEATLAESFRHVERLDQSSQFKCIRARKPKH
jgi:16S rRNA (guanine1207-N2)-methyltransferase